MLLGYPQLNVYAVFWFQLAATSVVETPAQDGKASLLARLHEEHSQLGFRVVVFDRETPRDRRVERKLRGITRRDRFGKVVTVQVKLHRPIGTRGLFVILQSECLCMVLG